LTIQAIISAMSPGFLKAAQRRDDAIPTLQLDH